MNLSPYDISIANYLQILSGLSGVMEGVSGTHGQPLYNSLFPNSVINQQYRVFYVFSLLE